MDKELSYAYKMYVRVLASILVLFSALTELSLSLSLFTVTKIAYYPHHALQ